jgi:hypothetical protein
MTRKPSPLLRHVLADEPADDCYPAAEAIERLNVTVGTHLALGSIMNASDTDLVKAAAALTRTCDVTDCAYLCDVRQATGLDAERFAAAALELWQADEVELTRADLVTALDTAKVEASELRYETETFHFIALSG